MRRFLPLLVWSCCYGFAFAQDVSMPASPSATSTVVTQPQQPPTDLSNYLLGLGPVGALVYGAYLLGKGVTVKIEVQLSEADRRLSERAVDALERAAEKKVA